MHDAEQAESPAISAVSPTTVQAQVKPAESTRGNASTSTPEEIEAAEAADWHRRLALLTASLPAIRTNSEDPGYWDEKAREISADRESGNEQ